MACHPQTIHVLDRDALCWQKLRVVGSYRQRQLIEVAFEIEQSNEAINQSAIFEQHDVLCVAHGRWQ